MTLNIRNTLMSVFIAVSLSAAAALGITAIYFAAAHTLQSIPDFASSQQLPAFIPFSEKSTAAAISSICILLMYVLLASIIIRRTFEKTQSPEIIYFSLFLVGIFLQCMRLCVPIFHLWQGYNNFFVLISRIYFTGQSLTAGSFLFSALFSSDNQVQDADRNLYILCTVAVILASLIPVKTDIIYANFLPQIGFQSTCSVILYVIVIITALILFFFGRTKAEYRHTFISAGFLMIMTGYKTLCAADSFAACAIGAVLLAAGTYAYLISIHRYYLWK